VVTHADILRRLRPGLRVLAMALVMLVVSQVVASCGARAGTPAGAKGPARAAVQHTLMSGHLDRHYMLYVPSRAQRSRRPRPLVIAFHGRLGTGRQMEQLTGFDALAEKHGFLVAYPDGIERSWNANIGATGPAEQRGVDDVGFTRDVIDDVTRHQRIDPSRVLATGDSNGGAFVHRLGCELSGRLAAIATVAGSMGVEQARSCQPTDPVAVVMIHGLKDDKMPWDGGRTLGGGTIISVPDAAAGWAARDGCARPAATRSAGPGVTRTSYRDCSCKTAVELYAIKDGGHAWPGGNDRPSKRARGESVPRPDASALIWRFFSSHGRPARCRR
jgi:polyhydroxybutyrate depolymerase